MELPLTLKQKDDGVSVEVWDEPVKCAKFIEKFTSYNLSDAESFNLRDYSRNDLEGIIQLLHGFYSYFMLENPMEIRETTKCCVNEVLMSMALASSIHDNQDGEIIINDELWGIIKNNPHLLNFLTFIETTLKRRSRIQ